MVVRLAPLETTNVVWIVLVPASVCCMSWEQTYRTGLGFLQNGGPIVYRTRLPGHAVSEAVVYPFLLPTSCTFPGFLAEFLDVLAFLTPS